MRRFWDLMKAHKKTSLGAWILVLVAVANGAQWQLGGTNPILTQVLGAQAKKPDVTPPSVSISFPADNGVYGPASWAGTLSGSASDATGVAKVEVAVQQQVGGKFWTGSAFANSSQVWLSAAGTTSWQLPLTLPSAEGSYIVSVQATDTATPASNTSSPVTATFRVDRTAPATPAFTKTPDDPTFDTKAQFTWRDAETGVTFACSLDGATPAACDPSGIQLKNLAIGTHTDSVWAVDAAGNRSGQPATFSWTILENKSFGISGNLTQALYPGVSRPLDLVLANPYNFAITVTSVTVTVDPATTKTTGGPNPACVGPTNLRVTQQLTGPATLAANATKSLSQLGVAPANWPQLLMPDLPTNQDDCKNTTFKLSYAGTAQKS